MAKENIGGSGQPFTRQHWAMKAAYCKENDVKFSFADLEEVEDYLRSDKLVCLECGQEFRGLANHIVFTHKHMSPKDYKIKYSIPVTMRLVGQDTSNKIAKAKKEHWRDPVYAELGYKNLEKNKENLRSNHRGGNTRLGAFRKKRDPNLMVQMQEKIAHERRSASEPKYIAAMKMAIENSMFLAKACRACDVTIGALWQFVRLDRTSDEIKKMYQDALAIPKNQAGVTGIRVSRSGGFQVRHKEHCKTVRTMEDAVRVLESFKNTTV